MTELYPIKHEGDILTVGSGGESIVINDSRRNLYLWVDPDTAVRVDEFIDERSYLRVGNVSLPIGSWVESVPYLNVRTFDDVDEVVRFLARHVRSYLEGKTVVLTYSGGKDSTAALILTLELQKYIDFKLRVAYVYMPYLEAQRNVRFVEYVGSRLGIDVEVLEPKRRYVRKLLKWVGLPRRGNRWCTYLKVRPLRDIIRGNPDVVEGVADRVFESPKRALRLIKRLKNGFIASAKRFTPVEFMTITDVMCIVKRYGLIHPAYIDGLPRVSCTLCPYKTLYEFNVREDLEDEGLIEEVLKKEHSKGRVYSKIPLDDFLENALWRFKPAVSYRLYRIKNALRKYLSDLEVKSYREVLDMHVRSWECVGDLRRVAEKVTIKDLINKLEGVLNLVGAGSGSG